MSSKFDAKQRLLSRSDRVKCVDLHPSEPLILSSLFTGVIEVWNYESQQMIKSLKVCDVAIRAAKFVVRKNWIITGSDDKIVRVFDYNTLEILHSFEAHSNYIRSLVVHPTEPYILTASDDHLIKLWNWEQNWTNTQVFEGHTNYVMQIVINPKDSNTFASASLDNTIKVWRIGSTSPVMTLEGHEKGVNCVDFSNSDEEQFLISGSDDQLVKIWNIQTKACVQNLLGHKQNISFVRFHPTLPIILSGSEDGTVKVWQSNNYQIESTLNFEMERVWTISCLKNSDIVAIGYDEGSVVIELKSREK